MSKNTAVLSLRDVAVSYRRRAGLMRWSKFWALNNVSFDLYQGETLGVVGRNGAGKSTLLRVLAGIISPDRGEVVNYGYSITLQSLRVGFIPHLTGRENAVLSGMLLGLHRSYIEERMDKIIEFSGLGDFIDQPVKMYSTGMEARLGFSVSIQMDPDIILVDEVLGVGDVEFRKKSSEAMKEKISSNKTVVIVSHDENMLREMCDRVLWIDKGESRSESDVDRSLSLYKQSYM